MIFSKGRIFASPKTLKDAQEVVWPHTILVDRKEQQPFTMQGLETTEPPPEPFRFDDFHMKYKEKIVPLVVPTACADLHTGDYTVRGMENMITVERKSIEDLFGTLTSSRERFENELDRMAAMDFAIVVVEGDWHRVMRGLRDRKVNPQSIFGSVIAYQQRWRTVHWWFADHRRDAETITFRHLRYYAEGIAVT
jgi:DNA excision repair protein ERCC-4